MIRKKPIIIVTTLGALFIVCIIATYEWLANQTYDITRFGPRLEQAVATAVPRLKVDLPELTARRDPIKKLIVVTAKHVRLHHALMTGPATLDQLLIRLDQAALLKSVVSIESAEGHGFYGNMNVSMIDVLHAKNNHIPITIPWNKSLNAVTLRDIVLDITESDSRARVHIVSPGVTIKRQLLHKAVLEINANATAMGSGSILQVASETTAKPFGSWSSDINLKAEKPSALVKALFPHIDMPTLSAPVTLDAKISSAQETSVSAYLKTADSLFMWPKFYEKPLLFKKLSFKAKWKTGMPHITLDAFQANLNDVSLQANAVFNPKTMGNSTIKANFDQASVAQMLSLWPKTVAVGGKTWVALNILKGSIKTGVFSLFNKLFLLDFDFDKLRVNYRAPMPMLENASGHGRLTAKRLSLAVQHGAVAGLNVTPATVVLQDIDRGAGNLLLTMPIVGSVPDVLALLDHQPFQFISRYGLKPETLGGNMNGTLHLKFPLLSDLSFDQIILNANAQTSHASIPDIFAKKPLANANLHFVITDQGLEANGSGTLGTQAIGLRWREDFTGRSQTPTQYDIKAPTSVEALALLGIDISGLASGPLNMDLHLNGHKGVISDGIFAADISRTQVELPVFGIVKPAGVRASLTGELRQDARTLFLNNMDLNSASVQTKLSGTIPLDTGRNHFDISSFHLGETQLAGTADYAEGTPLMLSIKGGTLDVRESLQKWRHIVPVSKPEPSSNLNTHVTAKLDKIRLYDNTDLVAVAADMDFKDSTLVAMNAKAKQSGADVMTRLVSVKGQRNISLQASDAGSIARGLNLFSGGKGGTLFVNAGLQGQGASLAIKGTAQMKDFRVINTPALAKLLTIASLTGLRDMVTGRGIPFDTVVVPFELRRGVFDIHGARATGASLGITLEGQVLQSLGKTDLRGVITPSYTLNSAVGNIPVLGKVLTGGKNQGLIGFNYRISGPVEDPKIIVAKSSGLAFGPLRQLFKGHKPALRAENGPSGVAN